MKYLRGLLLPALLALASVVAAKSDGPLIHETTWDTELVNLFYFDDSATLLVFELETGKGYRSTDAGKKWDELDFLTLGMIKSEFDKNVAVALGELEHHITYDQGETWTKFHTELPPSWLYNPIGFHATDNKKIIFNEFENCLTAPCLGRSYYTTDGFKTEPTIFSDNRKMCMWAKSSDRFLMDTDKLDDRIMCILPGKYSDRSKDFRLMISDNYFKDAFEPVMSSGRTVSGMANMASVKGYFVAAAKAENSKELALYVTDDTKTWHRAEFGHGKIEEDAYTILESTNYSIQVDVMTSRFAYVGSLYSSNSNGTYFTKNIDHTNRNDMGYVDFEKVSNIQGIVLVNVVDNWEKVNSIFDEKKLMSQITFDDGRTFEDLKVKGSDKKLHLHSVTNLHNSGRVFSSPAPGIVMGVGNTGDALKKYEDCDLWVSDDAGRTWELAIEEAHKYEFGNKGAVLAAVYDEGETDHVWYSLKHGRPDTWQKASFEKKMRARELTTVPDSTSLKFVLYGSRKKEGGGREYVMTHIDFAELGLGKCKDSAFEEWNARVDDDGKGTCVMGHKQIFRRRKWDADCFVPEDYNEPLPKFEPCECDEVRDYECDFNFEPKGTGKDKECVPSPGLQLPEGACQGDDKTYMGSSGWRKIPGNQCKGTTSKDEKKERECSEGAKTPASNKITSEITKFKGEYFRDNYYLERPSLPGDDDKNKKDLDETVVILTSEREAFVTHDHGKKWEKAVKDDDIVAIYPHQYNNDYVYFLTGTEKVYYSVDRAKKGSVHSFEAPYPPDTKAQVMQFHPNESDWVIWMGGKECQRVNDKACHTVASISEKNGQSWDTLLPYVKKCAFVWRENGQVTNEQEVFCEQYTNEEVGQPVELISSANWFNKKEVLFKSVVEFATMAEFIIVATKGGEDGKSLELSASLDATNFAEAKFPPKFEVDHQTAYTVLDSSTHSVFLHVTVNPRRDQEYGSLIKSNSNGTSYVLSINNVNRNTDGYVDFEKMQGIEGVSVANLVANVDDVEAKGAKKQKRTVITHNDGADWESLAAPAKDSDGKKYDCNVNDKKTCSLHLHGYTERTDPRETYSSPTAVGIMLGVGNVGQTLTTVGEASTFMTTDAGVTWKEIKKGNYAWEFGDQGSIIVIVRRGEDVDHVYYSLDMGENWQLYQFSDTAIRVEAITTVPSDTSLNFLLWGKDKKELVAVNLDFSGLEKFQRKCELNEGDPANKDYDLWTPQHPMLDDSQCLFGHVAQYHRKRADADCYNGEKIDHLHNIARNCTCTRRDFECDYNYEKQPGGECVLIPGLLAPTGAEVCSQKGVTEYWETTGYRKIPISTCQGGQEMEHTSGLHPCAGHEDEFNKKHGIGGFALFAAIVIPFVAAGGCGYYVWKNWDGKFGRIQLGDGMGGGGSGDSPLVKYPIMAVSAIVAVVAAIPLLLTSLWRSVSGWTGVGGGGGGAGGAGYGGQRYTSRSSFARGRGDYAVVDDDEGELLGEDSDEEV